MRHLLPTAFLISLCGPCVVLAAQAPAAPSPATEQTQSTPSAIMQPALATVGQTIGMLRPDKWKASDAIRQQTLANIESIHHDLETTLPQLLAAADGAPDSVSQVWPAYRNIEALYDVLLRVAEAGNLTAPSQQNAALERARAALEEGRRTLGDRLTSAALAQEQQVRTLQAAVRAVPPPPAPVACPPPPPVKKHKARKKVVKKPAPAPANAPSSVPASH
ncbi:hypothetical protein P8936_01555 [Edaphobacter paludis]|uniref:Uncharacterized protein n=1 Tax=Edaphobacter paludis TaxID=3035702 RepID=A0AAU7D9E2_9BACT